MHRPLLLAALLAAPVSSLTAQVGWIADSTLDQLFLVDLTTGATTFLGGTLNNGLSTPADLCWRDDVGQLFTIDLDGGEVGTLDPTGLFTPMWTTGISGWQAMAWDAQRRVFWLHNQNDNLYSLDLAGSLTTVGLLSPTTPLITAMECDALGKLWATNFSTGQILAINQATGLATVVAPTQANIQGLAIDADGRWFGISTSTHQLYSIDPATGAATAIGPTGGTFEKGFAISGSAVQRGGTACADGFANTRRMTWSGASSLGNTLQVGIEQGPLFAPANLLYGFSAQQAGPFTLPMPLAPFGAPGCTLYSSADAIVNGIVTGFPSPLTIPNAAPFVGIVAYVQGAIVDVSGSPNTLGLAFTDVARIVVTL